MNMLRKVARTVIYARSATNEPGNGIAEQEAAAVRLAEKHGLILLGTYSDVGISGLKYPGRKGLEAMLAEIESLDIDLILTRDPSRLSSSMKSPWALVGAIEEKGAVVYCCRDDCFLGKK